MTGITVDPIIVFAAFRYALGRSTYIVTDVADCVQRNATAMPAFRPGPHDPRDPPSNRRRSCGHGVRRHRVGAHPRATQQGATMTEQFTPRT